MKKVSTIFNSVGARSCVVLNLHCSEMTRVAEEYGGTVEKNTGDDLMAYFEDNSGDGFKASGQSLHICGGSGHDNTSGSLARIVHRQDIAVRVFE
jgi:class 3 adenylate cyclase